MKAMNSLWTMTRLLWSRELRDRAAFTASLVLPVVLMLFFGNVQGAGDRGPVTVAVADHDDTAASRLLLEHLAAEPALAVVREGHPGFERVAISVVIPGGFGRALAEGKAVTPVAVRWAVARAGDARGLAALSLVEGALADAELRIRGEAARVAVAAERPATSPGHMAFLLPGLIGMVTMMMGLRSGGLEMVRLRERGILKHLVATPLRPGLFAAAWTLKFFGSLLIRLVLLVLAAAIFFGFRLDAHLPSALVLVLLGAALFMALGLLVATTVRRVMTASAVVQVVALPIYFLSETFFSLRGAAPWVQAVVAAMPLTPLNEALRLVLVRGETLTAVTTQGMTLAGWLVASLLLLAWRLRDRARLVG